MLSLINLRGWGERKGISFAVLYISQTSPVGDVFIFYPALTGSNTPTPTSRLYGIRRSIGGGYTPRKSPIGSTNNQWGMKEPPTD
ncbi:hypothetical protein ACA29_24415 [Lederbergia galactosidilytica]|uniref:Uncharacterized protein n=1 Tax=Lederbergia galactosidilytica TaxID=217031 RepID=A0A0Q9XK36_9BACI|nr:hypothetical protein ACA29_24415 [Lederbergia galactosidilytica]